MPPLRAALADYMTALHANPVAEGRVQVTASGMAAVSVALMAVVGPGQRVVLHTPAWPNVGNAALLRGAVVNEIGLEETPDGGFALDLGRLDAMLAGARAFILNSPNNPTGWTATLAELREILAIWPAPWRLADFGRGLFPSGLRRHRGGAVAARHRRAGRPRDRPATASPRPGLMTGWRLGWMTVPAGMRDGISDIVEVVHSTVAPFIQRAGIAAIADSETVAAFRAHCARGRSIAGEALAGLNGVRYAAPPGAFYAFVGIEGLTDSLGFAKRLVVDHKVAVAPGIAFGAAGEGHLRICFAQSEQRLDRAVHRLRAGLQQEMGR